MGRFKISRERKAISITISIKPECYEKLIKLSSKLNINKSKVIQKLINEEAIKNEL